MTDFDGTIRTAPAADMQPSSAYEAITRHMVQSLERELVEIKSRLNNIFYIVLGSILVDMISRWMGA